MIPIRDTIPSRHAPVVTVLLIAVNAFIFFLELLLPQGRLEELFYLFGIVPARYAHPRWAQSVGFPGHDYWPFLTSMFLHGGWMHVVGNMWTLWIFGDNVEDRMGPLRFLTFYLLCGVAAGVLHLMTSPNSIVPTVGASGAIAGVMGAYFVLFPRSTVITLVPVLFLPLFIELPAIVFLAFWYLSQLFSGLFALGAQGSVGGIAWWAHAGGFIAGLALHRLFLAPYRQPRRFRAVT